MVVIKLVPIQTQELSERTKRTVEADGNIESNKAVDHSNDQGSLENEKMQAKQLRSRLIHLEPSFNLMKSLTSKSLPRTANIFQSQKHAPSSSSGEFNVLREKLIRIIISKF